MPSPTALVAAALGAPLLLGACTAAPNATEGGSATSRTAYATSNGPVRSPASSATSASPTAPTGTPASTPTPTPDPASIPALIALRYDAGDLRLGREGGSTNAYRQYFVTYESNGLSISGRINIPRGKGPFPAVVLAHGYVDPAAYTNGETMLRERDHLARHGYVTLHIDYRNHAQSSRDPSNDANLRTGYTVDAINAGLALDKAPFVDRGRIALIGRSMGGGVVLSALVARPGLFKAAVAYAPVSSDTVDNFDKWVRRDTSRAAAAKAVISRLGTPEAQPARWATTSPRTYFGRVTEPLLIHHGTADEDCPLAWSRETVAALKAEGKSVQLDVYPGGRHTLASPQWDTSIRRTAEFLATYLR
ncbi:hypothetical protein GCM10009740_37890 [Terrabacter terrae]|uniref:Peptidase S9 prolyl oligopeptidase catalytic domain-containing protein n=1 Tax=Terrabacter terrae TaxID=318434 RepID=A0ABN1ZMS3_9MICO